MDAATLKANPIRWSAYDHQHERKGTDWFIALGIIAISAALTSILFSNVLFALVIIVAAITFGLLANKEPETVEFIVTDKGLAAGESFHTYDTINAFWVDEGDEHPNRKHERENMEYPITLFIDTTKPFAPHLMIPVPTDIDPDDLREALRQFVEEQPLSEPLSHKILEVLGF